MPTFTPQQRKDITRRQLNIALENAAYDSTQAALSGEKAKLLSVDDANSVFYNIHKVRAQAYELEARQMSGVQAATYTDGVVDPYSAGDLTTSAKSPGSLGALFFPGTPTAYAFLVPKIVDAVNGYNFPVGTDARYESNILTNTTINQGLTEMIFRLSNGITGAISATTSTSTIIPAGDLTNFSVTVGSSTNFTSGDLLYINLSTHSGIYKVASIGGPTTIIINSIVPSQLGIGSTASMRNTVVAFTPTERQTLASSLYQEILTNVTSGIDGLVVEWEGKLNTQVTQIGLNNDDRSPQLAQLATALADVINSKSIIDSWQALPSTGITGRFLSASISAISAEITARQAFIPTRLAEIVVALGSVSQVGDVISGVAGSPYFERYKWVNIRINKASGSVRRFYAADDGMSFLASLSAANTAVKNEYDAYFLTKAIIFLDGTTIIHTKDTTGLFVGNTVTILSETQPELNRAIMEILGTTQLRLDLAIPNTYLVSDQARMFKTL